MTDDPHEDFWADLFHACALAAFLEAASLQQDWPNSDVTRIRAYQLYEKSLWQSPSNGEADASLKPA